MAITYTPIRYPGGKTKLYPEIKAILGENGLLGHPYAELFAGGAGLAVKLLLKGDVSSVVINDYDRAVYCMWDAIVNHGAELCEFIDSAVLDIETWKRMRDTYQNHNDVGDFELGKAAFYLNRTNVSGILSGGVIGGLAQAGNYKMDVRFNRETLKKKVMDIVARKDDIEVTRLDAEEFIDNRMDDSELFAYLDPPYVQKGPGLYRSSFDEERHRSLARKVGDAESKWVVTYDADELIDDIYSDYERGDLEISYTANIKTIGREKIILGPGLDWPEGMRGEAAK
ncbi:DNA adenine methylase [Parolsenella catena]|uniref:DNA adenine methylase n=1 Tax=Parolsenella catena TaxID=2003188 RepID=UPI0018970719|nr:DNA adenine methylase [Parolsenella catena]